MDMDMDVIFRKVFLQISLLFPLAHATPHHDTPAGAATMAQLAVQNANTCFKSGEFEKAAKLYAGAASEPDADAMTHCNLSYSLLKIGKYAKALEAADKTLELEPTNQRGHQRRALSLIGMKQYEDAIAAAELAVSHALANSPARREAQELLGRAKWFCKATAEADNLTVPAAAVDAVDPAAEKENLSPAQRLKNRQRQRAALRNKQHVKEEARKYYAQTEAETELEAPAAVAAAEAAASALPEEELAALSSAEEIKAASSGLCEGDPLAYDSARVGRFAAAELKGLREAVAAGGDKLANYVHPIAVFLPGVHKEGWGDEGSGVSMRGSFDSVKTYSRVPGFLQQYTATTRAHALLVMTPKSQVAYPQIWGMEKFKAGWGSEQGCSWAGVDGFLCQLETPKPEDRSCWFVQADTGVMHDLDEATHGLLVPPPFQRLAAAADKAAKRGGGGGGGKKGKKKGGRR